MRPTVSCICVTGKDHFHLEHFLPVAIKCFLAQNYPAALRELILVSERELPPGCEQSQVSGVVATGRPDTG